MAGSLLDTPLMDINTATTEELQDLPGIGPVKARALVDFRTAFGPFTCLDDLLGVPGIGPATVDGIEDLIEFSDTEGAFSDTLHWLPLRDSIESPLLSVTVLDIGEGDAVLIRAAGGQTVLVDGGPDLGGPVMPPVIARLALAGIDSLDAVIITHPHEDHIGGLVEVVREIPVGRVYDPAQDFQSPFYIDLLEAVDSTGTPYSLLEAGMVLDLSPSVRLTVLDDGSRAASSNINEACAVMRLECGCFSMLLAGDIEEGSQQRLTPSLEPVVALLAPHHGARSSAFVPFMRRTRPMLVMMSAGRDNLFGHPHLSVIEGYTGLGAMVLRTDRQGSILLDTDGTGIAVHTSM
jgi:competence protein ComEC